MLDKIEESSILFDFYGELLPQKQREIFRLYYEDNYSLAEIAAEYKMTRQGVHEAVKHAMDKLKVYEEKLGLVAKFQGTESVLLSIEQEIETLLNTYETHRELCERLSHISKIMDRLSQ